MALSVAGQSHVMAQLMLWHSQRAIFGEVSYYGTADALSLWQSHIMAQLMVPFVPPTTVTLFQLHLTKEMMTMMMMMMMIIDDDESMTKLSPFF